MRTSTSRRLFAVATVVAIAAAGCGGSAGGAASGGSGSHTSDSAGVKYAKAQIAKYSEVPKFKAAGGRIDVSKLAGKSIFSIPDSSANPFAANILAGEAAAAKAAGVQFRDCKTQGQVADWVRCYGEASSRNADLILSCCGVDPRVVRPQIAQAQKRGTPVLAPHVYGMSQTPVAVDTSIPAPYEQAGRLMADWIISDTKANADVLVVTSNEVTGTPAILSGAKDEFTRHCGDGCKLSYVNVPVADWATKIQSEVQSALQRDPKINYILPLYDSMSQFVVPAIRAAQKVGKVHISTYNGTPFVLKYMQDEDIVRMDVGESEDWMGWAYMDAALRALGGQKLPQSFPENTPLRVFTRDNVKQAGTPPKASEGYGTAYIDKFKALWGLQ